jgi:hypothetical protein
MAKRPITLFVCVALAALAGCGDETKGIDLAQVRSVVTQFAEADDAHACELLSPNALVNVYGGFKKPVEEAHAICVRRSSKFKGEPVTITNVNPIDPDTVRVTALNPKGDVTYNVAVRRFGPAWRIDEISQSKTEQ